MKYFFAFSAILLLQYATVDADCNECNNVHACVSKNTFSVCFNGTPTKQYVTCPAGTVCTSGIHICQPGGEPNCKRSKAKPKSQCGLCEDENHVFACISESVIAFCFGQKKPFYSALATCPEGTVCDLNNKNGLCSPREEAWPTCYSTEDSDEQFDGSRGVDLGGSCSADTATTEDPEKSTTYVEKYERREQETTTATSPSIIVSSSTTQGTEKTTAEAETTTGIESTTEQETTTGMESTTEQETTGGMETTTGIESTTEQETTAGMETTTGIEFTTEQETTTGVESTTEQETTTEIGSTTEKETTTGIESTTEQETNSTPKQTEETTTTTGAPNSVPIYPGDNFKSYCGSKKFEAYYPNIYDPTCETFIYCVLQNRIWMGVEMYCDDEYKWFDPEINQCSPIKPANCI